MKKFKNGTLLALCSFTLVLTGFFRVLVGPSLLFFGEPDYPTEE